MVKGPSPFCQVEVLQQRLTASFCTIFWGNDYFPPPPLSFISFKILDHFNDTVSRVPLQTLVLVITEGGTEDNQQGKKMLV